MIISDGDRVEYHVDGKRYEIGSDGIDESIELVCCYQLNNPVIFIYGDSTVLYRQHIIDDIDEKSINWNPQYGVSRFKTLKPVVQMSVDRYCIYMLHDDGTASKLTYRNNQSVFGLLQHVEEDTPSYIEDIDITMLDCSGTSEYALTKDHKIVCLVSRMEIVSELPIMKWTMFLTVSFHECIYIILCTEHVVMCYLHSLNTLICPGLCYYKNMFINELKDKTLSIVNVVAATRPDLRTICARLMGISGCNYSASSLGYVLLSNGVVMLITTSGIKHLDHSLTEALRSKNLQPIDICEACFPYEVGLIDVNNDVFDIRGTKINSVSCMVSNS